jgi:hypothetical protein
MTITKLPFKASKNCVVSVNSFQFVSSGSTHALQTACIKNLNTGKTFKVFIPYSYTGARNPLAFMCPALKSIGFDVALCHVTENIRKEKQGWVKAYSKELEKSNDFINLWVH